MHIFLHLLLPICFLPAAAWLCTSSPGWVRMTACRVHLSGVGGLRDKRKVFRDQEETKPEEEDEGE